MLASGLPAAEQQQRRIAYYEYVGTGPGPRINVIQDIDGPDAGFGAFWGEVQSSVHKALGSLGVITDGSIRDIAQWAPGFQALAGSIGPSHAYVHAENFGGEVRVAGMTVRSGDLIHADRHGAVVIPLDVAAKLPDAAELCGRKKRIHARYREKLSGQSGVRFAEVPRGQDVVPWLNCVVAATTPSSPPPRVAMQPP